MNLGWRALFQFLRILRPGEPGYPRRHRIVFMTCGFVLLLMGLGWLWFMTTLTPGGSAGGLAVGPLYLSYKCFRESTASPTEKED